MAHPFETHLLPHDEYPPFSLDLGGPMLSPIHSSIRELDRADIDAVLSRQIIGRLAYLREGRIAVTPVNYAHHGGVIYGRTGRGGKLGFLENEGSPVAFQVDEITTGYSWKSVLAHGTFGLVRPENGEEQWRRAVEAVRRTQCHALADNDPFPERSQLFRITIDELSARALG